MHRTYSFLMLLFVTAGLQCLLAGTASAQLMQESTATTEQSCSFGMGKGEPSHSCAVPFPPGCRVAQAPGSSKRRPALVPVRWQTDRLEDQDHRCMQSLPIRSLLRPVQRPLRLFAPAV